MGHFKELQNQIDEEYRRGYISPVNNNKFIGYSLFKNKYLSRYIKEHGIHGKCSYSQKETIVMEFCRFMDYVGERITSYVGPIDQEGLYLASSFLDDDEDGIPGYCRYDEYIAPEDVKYYGDVHDVMRDYDLVTEYDKLNKDIENCFNVDRWIRKDPIGLQLQDDLIYSWRNFCSLVKNKIRYTFFRYDEYYQDIEDKTFKGRDIIQEISNIVQKVEETIPIKTKLYRGRPEGKGAPYNEFSQLTSPPSSNAKSNRMSCYGISMFYGSFDEETPKKEIKNYLVDKNTKIYLGEFEVKKPLKVINLCNIPAPDFWMEEEDDWQKYAFLHIFHEEISKPIGTNDKELEYIPTQVLSEYLRYIQKTSEGGHYDGIIYQSSLNKKKNIVLFYDQKESAEILELNKTL